jgi:hypothetical protein
MNTALQTLLCVPCVTCGREHDMTLDTWVGWFTPEGYVNQCSACFERENPSDDVDISGYRVYLIKRSQLSLFPEESS